MSEFEFVLSVTSAHESTAHEVGHMLAADELFFKGKLLPLYVPEFSDGSELPIGSCNAHDGLDKVKVPATSFSNQQAFLDKPSTPCLATHNDMNAENFVVKSSDLIIPTSPKAPRCSIKLKCLFGLKKLIRSCCSCAISGNMNFTSFTPAKFSRRKVQKEEKNKHRSGPLILQQNVPLSVNKDTQLSYQSGDVNAKIFASDPLLRCCKGGKQVMSLCRSVNAPKDRFQALSHNCHASPIQRMNATTSLYSCRNAADMACKQRCNNVSVTDFDSLAIDKIPDELSVSGSSKDAIKLSFRMGSYEETHSYKGFAEDRCRESRRSLMQDVNVSKVGLKTVSSCVLLNAANGGSKGQQAALGTVMNGFKSLNVSRVKSLERSNSYSPKSLQRKYDQLKVMRQREGWRVLERSSSYNGSMHRIRVAPVLNVPIVCMSRSKSVNNTTDPGSGHNLFSKRKNVDVNFRVTSTISAGKHADSSKV